MAKKQKKFKGSVLAYVLVVMTVVLIILVSMLSYVVSQLRFSQNRVERERSFQIAESGVYFYRWYLAHQTSGKTAQQVNDFWQGGTALGIGEPYENDYYDPEGGKIGRYKIEVNPPGLTAPDSGSTIVTVRSTGWTYKAPNIKRVVQVRFRKPSWSEYMFLTDDFINFGDQAEVFGKIHSNTGIRFDGVAHNIVSSLPPSFYDPSHGFTFKKDFGVHTHQVPADPSAPNYPWASGTVPNRPDVFEAGRVFPVPKVNFNGVTTDLSSMKTAARSPSGTLLNNCTTTGCYFNEDGNGRRIILKTDGTFDTCVVNKYNSTTLKIKDYKKNTGSGVCSNCFGDCVKNFTIPNGGIIFVEDDVWVEGTVNNKKVTITAANLLGWPFANIYLGMSNIRYSNYDCNNVIGLVAQHDISLIGDTPSDFIIDAALLAQSGRVGMNDYGSSNHSLTINGALSSFEQPYFNHGNSGFGIRIYNFDNNLLYCPPAYFPTGSEYSIDLWEEL